MNLNFKKIHPLMLWATLDFKKYEIMKTEQHETSQRVVKMSSQYLFSHQLVVVMCLLWRVSKLWCLLLLYQRKKKKVCVGTRDLWSDANIVESPNADRCSWPVVAWLQEKKCSLMQTTRWPAVRALKSTLRQLANSQTATYSTVDVL